MIKNILIVSLLSSISAINGISKHEQITTGDYINHTTKFYAVGSLNNNDKGVVADFDGLYPFYFSFVVGNVDENFDWNSTPAFNYRFQYNTNEYYGAFQLITNDGYIVKNDDLFNGISMNISFQPQADGLEVFLSGRILNNNVVDFYSITGYIDLDAWSTAYGWSTLTPYLVDYQFYYYDNGEMDSYKTGYDKGLEDGMLSTEEGGLWYNLFVAVLAPFTLLEIEIFPGVTLGMIALIPIIFGLIAFIFKLGGKSGGK